MLDDSRGLTSALFVDFDNLFLRLRAFLPPSPLAFAVNPRQWLGWFEAGMPRQGSGDAGETPRRLLMMCSYMNPRFGRFRDAFVHTGFRVVDCPTLTTHGKTNADMEMALDVVDALGHDTRFDEFIILSGDADFTPVLRRCREHDRRTTIVAVGHPVDAYTSVADVCISQREFVQHALGFPLDEHQDDLSAIEPRDPQYLADRPIFLAMAQRLLEQAQQNGGEVAYRDLERIFRSVHRYGRRSYWMGRGSRNELIRVVVGLEPRLEIVTRRGKVLCVRLRQGDAAGEPLAAELDQDVLQFIRDTLAASENPVHVNVLELKLREAFPRLKAQWSDTDEFYVFLKAYLDALGFEATSDGIELILDPRRHSPPQPSKLKFDLDDAE